jgi:hypothetical protein
LQIKIQGVSSLELLVRHHKTMDAHEVSELVEKHVEEHMEVRLSELGLGKLQETFTRYRIIAATVIVTVGLLIGTQAYTKWFTDIFYDLFPLPEDHVAVAYSEVFELSLRPLCSGKFLRIRP